MDVKVLSSFTDRHTDQKHKKGDVLKGITKERFNEILEKGNLVEAVVPKEKNNEKK